MEDLSEKEQLDAIRSWWSENGNYVIGGIIVGVALIVGWNQWQSRTEGARVAASALYEQVMDATGDGDIDAANAAASRIFADFADTPYAAQARLALARLYMDTGRDQDAADALAGLLESDPGGDIALVGRLRLAKILLYQDKAEEAVALLSGPKEHAFASRYNETLGDALAALGRYDEAQAAYIAALNDDPIARTVDFNIIQLKLNDLPAPAAPDAGESATAAPADPPTTPDGAASPSETPASDGAADAGAADPEADETGTGQ